MLFVHFFTLSGIALMGFCYLGINRRRGKLPKYCLTALFLAALSIRLLAAALSNGFGSDTVCFAAWADRMFQVGPAAFYSPEVFTDYPPGYMYVLWLLGAVRKLFGFEYYSISHLALLRLPAICCDMVCGWLLFREAGKKCSEIQAFFLCMAYLLNPAIILNSSVWGQVDSIFTLAVVYMCLCLMRGRLSSAYIAFGIGVLIKPQTLIFSPLLLAGFIDWVFLKNLPFRKTLIPDLLRNLFYGFLVILGMVILCLPFGLENIWELYLNTVNSYPYAAVNACNLWGLLGLNWVSQENTLLGIPYWLFGFAAIIAAIALILYLSLRNRGNREKYAFLGAVLILSVFVFSVRMHERYMYPGLILLLLAYVYNPSRLSFLAYGGFSVMHFYNTAYVLFFYDPYNYDRSAPLILLTSAGMMACIILVYYVAWKYYRSTGAGQAAWDTMAAIPIPSVSGKTVASPHTSRKGTPLKKADFICMLAITLIYSCFALYDLGDLQAPVTAYDMVQNQVIELDFGSEIPTTLSYYIAPWHSRAFRLEGKPNAAGEWRYIKNMTLGNVFTWQEISIEAGVSHLRLTLQETQASLLEFVFLDESGNIITPLNASEYPALFDEAFCHPEVSTFRNSMYFDEIYHGRTAYEFINGLTSYENTHPPLGKILIAAGVALFGMNPFGWRIIGTLFGIAMVPVIYLFARKVLDNIMLAALTCVLFSFDFMHFAQTRLATIDVYITFFVILMYYFMYQYSQISFFDTKLKKTWLPLGACGICMGLGIACKWTGVYAGVGLALIFFSILYRRYREYVYAKKHPSGSTGNISHKHIISSFLPYTKRTILFCLVFFVAVPALIYLLSYIPFRDYSDRGLINRMLYNQKTMFTYHSSLNDTHPFSSSWYEWPIIKRPIWYYSRIVTQPDNEDTSQESYITLTEHSIDDTLPDTAEASNLREGISSFGNPAVWWAGIPAALYMVYLWIRKKDKNAAFLFVGYIAQYLPWFFVTRVTFIYHYFPCVAFVTLMITYSMAQWREKLNKPAFLTMAILYGGAAVGLFLMFYPVLSGQPVEASYVDKYLRWFKSWVLTAR